MRKALVRGLVVLLGLGVAQAVTPSAAQAAIGPEFTDPVFWPLQAESYVDCTTSNAGCTQHHDFWGVDVIPTGQRHRTGHNPYVYTRKYVGVYAMGAGYAYIGDAHGEPCGFGGHSNWGTWIWIDHGGGVVSRYGHLSSIKIRNGQHVNAGQQIGISGNTGDGKKAYCGETYLDFQVRKDGLGGPSVPFSTSTAGAPDGNLLGCTSTGVQPWPRALYGGKYADIDVLPEGTNIPGSLGDCLTEFTAASINWQPGVRMSAGRSSLRVSWSGVPTGVDQVRVQLSQYQPGSGNWDSATRSRWRQEGPGTDAATFTGLHKKYKYRATVWFHNAGGWEQAGGTLTGHPR